MNLEFKKIIKKLDDTPRQGWIDRGLQADSIGSHIRNAIPIGVEIAKNEGADPIKVGKLLETHDLVQDEMNDVTPGSGRYIDKREMEKMAMQKIAARLSEESRLEYLELFNEFRERNTKEANVAVDADKLETIIRAEKYEIDTGRKDVVLGFADFYDPKIKTKSGREMLMEIRTRHEERKRVKL